MRARAVAPDALGADEFTDDDIGTEVATEPPERGLADSRLRCEVQRHGTRLESTHQL